MVGVRDCTEYGQTLRPVCLFKRCNASSRHHSHADIKDVRIILCIGEKQEAIISEATNWERTLTCVNIEQCAVIKITYTHRQQFSIRTNEMSQNGPRYVLAYFTRYVAHMEADFSLVCAGVYSTDSWHTQVRAKIAPRVSVSIQSIEIMPPMTSNIGYECRSGHRGKTLEERLRRRSGTETTESNFFGSGTRRSGRC